MSYTYSYDENGRCVLEEYEDLDSKKKSRQKYGYKGTAMQPSSISHPGMASTNGAALTYNEKGDITAYTDLNPGVESEMNGQYFAYEYDKAGNWTKVTETGFGEGYKTRLIEYFPVEESSDARYKKLIMEYSEPSMSAFSNLGQAAMGAKKEPSALLADLQLMLAQAKTDIAKLKSIPDLPGNNTKQLVLQFIEYISSASTTKKLQNIFRKEGDYASDLKEIGTQVSTKRTEMMAEFNKLP